MAKTAHNGVAPVTVGSANRQVVCPAGCATCNIGNSNAIVCSEPLPGYSFDTSGNIVRCADSCKTCSSSDSNACTSCFGASRLSGTTCSGCQDSNAASCTGSITWADSCIPGYTPVNGSCSACASNCLSCGTAGANNCDDGGCGPGYVVITGTSNCTGCFAGCATCSNRSPNLCASCVNGQYLTNSSLCASCATGCETCTSASVCSLCIEGYVLISNVCTVQLPFPCSAQDANGCTACYVGYIFSNGNCNADTSCNADSSCISCPTSQYLSSGQCQSCTTDSAVCDYCKPTAPNECQQCVATRYLVGTSCNLCSTAMTGCTRCRSSTFCTRAADAYYLRQINGAFNG